MPALVEICSREVCDSTASIEERSLEPRRATATPRRRIAPWSRLLVGQISYTEAVCFAERRVQSLAWALELSR